MGLLMPDAAHEFHFYEDFSITPAYALGYAFHALGRIDSATSTRGRQGVLALLNELFATLTSLRLEASLLAAGPLRAQQQAMASRSHARRIGPVAAAEIVRALAVIEVCVGEELRGRAGAPDRRSPSHQSGTRLRAVSAAGCPHAVRADLTEGCCALDAQLYTAAVFHFYRVWEGLSPPPAPAAGSAALAVADPRRDPAVRCTRAEAMSVFEAIRGRLESPTR